MTITESAPAPVEALPTTRNTLHVINGSGDTRVMWTIGNVAETEGARAHFNAMKAQGYSAHTVDRDGVYDGEVIREFDPNAGEIVMRPPLEGG